MYHPFFQFVLPRIGQAALDVLLYVNFLQLPPLQLVSAWPVLYYGLPLLLMLLLAYISRDPLGLGIVFTGHLVTFYCIGTGIALRLMRRRGWYAAIRLAHFLAGWHNTMAADGFHHVVGPPPRPETVYHKI